MQYRVVPQHDLTHANRDQPASIRAKNGRTKRLTRPMLHIEPRQLDGKPHFLFVCGIPPLPVNCLFHPRRILYLNHESRHAYSSSQHFTQNFAIALPLNLPTKPFELSKRRNKSNLFTPAAANACNRSNSSSGGAVMVVARSSSGVTKCASSGRRYRPWPSWSSR